MPSQTTRRRALGMAGGAIAAALAGCTSAVPGMQSGDGGGPTTTARPKVDPGATTIGMLYATGGLGDESFNDMANRGVKKARVEFGVEYKNEVPAKVEDMGKLQTQYAESTDPAFDLTVCVGFLQQSSLKKVSKEHPDQQFMLIDSVVQRDNVANYTFKEHEGSFQVGHLAGLLTNQGFSAGAGQTRLDRKTVGFVGGVESGLIEKFEAGFKAGVAHADENVEVLTSYVGSFADAEGGKAAAQKMYDDGADIVYHAAGGSGIGVFQAAQENGRFAIGVDSDQSASDPRYANVILASMVKRVDTAVFQAIENVHNDEFGGGSITSLGLEQNGVKAVYGSPVGEEIPDGVKSKLDDSRQAIIGGSIDVPSTMEEN
ncbi:BMP family lipoprotein [Haloarchaeobius sp. TZWWS8]|uniref:BMP family lipoprotein n=1 Tax=Haloarchaeobius sp. TZWWS8 TaxID=3446121 RepID=UPI003EBFB9E4